MAVTYMIYKIFPVDKAFAFVLGLFVLLCQAVPMG